MEKYGYKQGSGLGKTDQGMSTALHVEKTGHREGKIIHEKDLAPKGELPDRTNNLGEMCGGEGFESKSGDGEKQPDFGINHKSCIYVER